MSSRHQTLVAIFVTATLIAVIILLFKGNWALDLGAVYLAARSYGLDQVDLIYLSPPNFLAAVHLTRGARW